MKKYKIKDIQLVVICDRKYNYSGNNFFTAIEKNSSISFVKTKDLSENSKEIIDIFGRKLITVEEMSVFPSLYQNFVKAIIKSEPLELILNNKDRNFKVSHDDLREMTIRGYKEFLINC